MTKSVRKLINRNNAIQIFVRIYMIQVIKKKLTYTRNNLSPLRCLKLDPTPSLFYSTNNSIDINFQKNIQTTFMVNSYFSS